MEVIIKTGNKKGFSLLEILIAMVILALLAGTVVPVVQNSITRAKEAALKKDLQNIRLILDDYYSDHGHFPENLESLVEEQYIRKIPNDPITGRMDWQLSYDEENEDEIKGIKDIHSSSPEVSLDGETYSDW